MGQNSICFVESRGGRNETNYSVSERRKTQEKHSPAPPSPQAPGGCGAGCRAAWAPPVSWHPSAVGWLCRAQAPTGPLPALPAWNNSRQSVDMPLTSFHSGKLLTDGGLGHVLRFPPLMTVTRRPPPARTQSSPSQLGGLQGALPPSDRARDWFSEGLSQRRWGPPSLGLDLPAGCETLASAQSCPVF